MTDTKLSDAVVFPEDEGTGVVDEKADRASAGHAGLLAQHAQGCYVDKGCAFANVDTTNEQVDITAGHAFLELDSVSIQSGAQATYDTTLPNPIVICVVLPTDVVDLGLDADATNDIWLAVDATTNDGAYLRHGSGLSAPADPSVKLGTVDTASGSTTRASDDVPLSNNVDAGGKDIRNVGSLDTDEASIGAAHITVQPSEGTKGIQQAVNSLPSDGGLIWLTKGTYKVNNGSQHPGNAIIIDKPNTAIVGQGRQTVIQTPDGYADNGDKRGQKVIDVGGTAHDDGNDDHPGFSGENYVDGCYLAHFRVDGNYQNQGTLGGAYDGHNIEITGSDTHVFNVWSINSTGDGVEMTSHSNPPKSQRNIVSGSTFRDNWEQCVHVHGGGNSIVANNHMDGEVNNGVLALTAGKATYQNVLIQGNTIRNGNNVGAKLHGGVDNIEGVSHVRFDNNIVAGNGEVGVELRGEGGSDIWVTNNTIRQNTTHGIIGFGDQSRAHIIGNDISENGQSGIFFRHKVDSTTTGPLQDINIQGNWIRNNNTNATGNEQLRVTSDGELLKDFFVTDNRFISDSGSAESTNQIQLTESSVGTYEDIIAENNIFKGSNVNRAILSVDIPMTVRDNDGYDSTWTGKETFSGDGAATSFSGTHGLRALGLGQGPPNKSDVELTATAVSGDAISASIKQTYVTDPNADGQYEGYTVEFESAPASGTNNVVVRITARHAGLEG